MKQLSFATLAYENKKKLTKREKFLNEMEAAVPWDRLLKVCEPYYPKAGKGRKPMPLETMLRIYYLQQWYGLSDPEMSSTKKGNTRHFGMKAHISVDAKSGLIHTVGVTTEKTHDAKVTDQLIREDDKAVFGDKGYVSDKLKKAAREACVYWAVLDKAKPKKTLSATQKKRNKKHSSVRAKVEHPFRIIKCQFGYRKTRYRGLKKNAAQVFVT